MNEYTNQHTGTKNMEPMEHRNGTQGTRDTRIVGNHPFTEVYIELVDYYTRDNTVTQDLSTRDPC
jgi:hypothetical protein